MAAVIRWSLHRRDRRRIAAAHRAPMAGARLRVGGFVRDRLLGRPVRRISTSRSSAFRRSSCSPSLRSLGRVEPVGQAFPSTSSATIDVALPRRESKTGRGHKGFTVEGDPTMTFEEAARRRDFTINAIGWDPLTGRVPRSVSRPRRPPASRPSRRRSRDAFADDSLRVLRALQFAARFELTIDPETRASARRSRSTICRPSASGANSRSCCCRRSGRRSASRWRASSASIHQLLPEMEALYDCPQDPEWHPEGNVWIHTLMVIDKARRVERRSRSRRGSPRSCSARSVTTSASRRRRR